VTESKPDGRRYGWSTRLSRIAGAGLVFLSVGGLAVTFGPFHPVVQWALLVHAAIGTILAVPLVWYTAVHWLDYRRFQFSHIVLLGYVAGLALVACVASGLVVTWQGVFGIRMSWAWRQVHLVSTFAVLGAALPHVVLLAVRVWRTLRTPRRYTWQILGASAALTAVTAGLPGIYAGTRYVNEFPKDYKFLYGTDRPFAPSLAKTTTGGAYDARSLAGSEGCGTAGCHQQIVEEWRPSAHRYSAMDPLFQFIQTTMAKQNGPESTRYCGGCHDPISLFSGTKNIFVKDLTNLQGYQEGVSCLACHGIRKTDVKGNADFIVAQPREYLWQWNNAGAPRVARDFLIRTYPDEHAGLSKRLFKSPEYCAACHKQFIDQQVNNVGWVQLQNQYDNWANSHWNKKGDPRKTVECRECHMPLVDSHDPAAGDTADYNRSATDGKHRSHRFIASNSLMPRLLKLDGADEQIRLTEQWLHGERRVPEIEDKWAKGAIVSIALDLGTARQAGTVPVRVVLTSNKVGHDYPTGPLDLIQSWVELHVVDDAGHEIFTSGTRDEKNFIAPGSFLFKAEPVDQYGNLIDRHNLWEMVGVRFRRALFPGYSDTVQYDVNCSGATVRERAGDTGGQHRFDVPPPARPGTYRVTAILQYRKVDQFLVNYFLGDHSGITAPVVEIARATALIEVRAGTRGAPPTITFTRTGL
jgi:hypothetical protein